ncbi:hypothetical protein DMENIID0001_020460 [Sergentomyia squamirostris]
MRRHSGKISFGLVTIALMFFLTKCLAKSDLMVEEIRPVVQSEFFKVYELDYTSVFLKIDPKLPAKNKVTELECRLDVKESIEEWSDAVPLEIPCNYVEILLDNLEPETLYSVRTVAGNQDIEEFSPAVEFQTKRRNRPRPPGGGGVNPPMYPPIIRPPHGQGNNSNNNSAINLKYSIYIFCANLLTYWLIKFLH